MAEPSAALLEQLLGTIRKLRGPDGCSWDREQTVRSLRPYLLEEAYEVADAADRGDPAMLRAELGDLLLHVVMSAVICEEDGLFSLEDVIRGIREKLIRRHPHVFGTGASLSPAEVERQWESIKATEKVGREESFFGSFPPGMPALQTAWRLQQRASDVGFDWPDAEGAREKIQEELKEFERAIGQGDADSQEEELGDVLFSIVNFCRLMGFEPEAVLRRSNRKFVLRFSRMESILKLSGVTLEASTLDQMEEAWIEAKHLEHAADRSSSGRTARSGSEKSR
jgi:tetrapyrrole methylase family protein / MazG family protein